MEAVKELWTEVVEPSWLDNRGGSLDGEKKALLTGFIHSASGIGKTRFNLEFLRLLADYLAPAQHQPEWNDEVESLRAALKNRKTMVLNVHHNGKHLEGDEFKWPPAVILGLRLAHQYWMPHVRYEYVRTAFQRQATKVPTLWDTFTLARVLAATQQHKAAPTRANLSPHIPEVLHIAIDDIQMVCYKMVPCGEGLEQSRSATAGPALEPLSTALNRALQGAISQTHGLFVIGTLSGTAARHTVEVLDTTDAPTLASVLLPPLSADAVRQIAASIGQPNTVGGREWCGKPFERLLATTGGNPRVLECLESVLEDTSWASESLDLNDISAKLIEKVTWMFNVEGWDSKGRVVMEVPIVLAQAALEIALSRQHLEHDRELIKEADRLLTDCRPFPASFGRVALKHRVLRHRVASEWARRQGRAKHGETQDDNTLSHSDGAGNRGCNDPHEHAPEQERQRRSRPRAADDNTGGDGGDGGEEEAKAADPGTCLITSTDDSLAWAMGPTFARFFVP
jgi:hypothetical protein